MHTGVEHGPQPDVGSGAAPDDRPPRVLTDGREHVVGPAGTVRLADGHGPASGPIVLDDDIPTTILDLRTAFAQAGPQDAAPLGVVHVEREHPVRAGLAFVAVLALIAGVATGAVVGTAALGKAVYARLLGPAECSTAQVADGAALETWLLAAMRETVGPAARVARTGCVTSGVLDPLTGQSAAATVGAARTPRLLAVLKKRDCTLGRPSSRGTRSCTVEVDDRLAVVEYRPARGTVTTTVSFR